MLHNKYHRIYSLSFKNATNYKMLIKIKNISTLRTKYDKWNKFNEAASGEGRHRDTFDSLLNNTNFRFMEVRTFKIYIYMEYLVVSSLLEFNALPLLALV